MVVNRARDRYSVTLTKHPSTSCFKYHFVLLEASKLPSGLIFL